MFQHCLVLYLAALVLARPETYKEKEEFNYSRSSTDEGSKSGFYAAQRGNIGGNFEKAHNMDHVAQGQMSDIVSQVGAQAPDIADSKQGDLYGSAYTKGIYGQRRFDTSNLAGRNFQENVYTDASNSQKESRYVDRSSTLGSTGSTSIGSEASRYQQGYGTRANLNSGSTGTFGISQSADVGSYGTGSAYESTHTSGYQASSQHRSSAYDRNHPTSEVISPYRVVPVRIAVRPLQPVNLGVQAGRFDQSADSTFIHNEQENRAHSANSLAQNTDRLHTIGAKTGGLDTGKHYESSYNYRKEWEKHSEVTPVPLAIPTVNDEQVGSSDNQAYRQIQYRQSQSSNSARNIATLNTQTAAQNHQEGYKADGFGYQRVAEPITNRYVVLSPTPEFVISGSKQGSHSSSHLSGYNDGSRSESQSSYGDQSLARGHLSTNSDNLLASSSRNHDAALVADVNSGSGVQTGAKKYESAYSYHKSWEKQGDPYIIQPAFGPVVAQPENVQAYPNRGLGTKSARYSAHSSHGEQEECDEHQRYTRSAYEPRMHIYGATDINSEEGFGKQDDDYGQKTEDLGQHPLEFGQESQDLGQQTQDLVQQTEEFGQPSETFGQQTESFVPSSNKELGNGRQTQRAWQYIEANHPVLPKSYQPSESQMEDFVGQLSQEQI